MEQNYRNELDRIRLSQGEKDALVQSMTRKNAPAKEKKPRRVLRGSLAAAIAACTLMLTATAAVLSEPILDDYFGNTPGYQQSSAALGASDTEDGWTATVTDCVGDDQTIWFGIEITAPEGTVLDDDKEYVIDNFGFDFPDIRYWYGRMSGGGSFRQLEDDDPTDNKIRFLASCNFFPEEGTMLHGERIKLKFGKLCYPTTFNEEEGKWELEYLTRANWSITTTASYPDSTIRLTPNLPVMIEEAEAVITAVEVSPINVFIHIKGDSLKGHHKWMPMTARDGWYDCDGQDVILYTKDGTGIPLRDHYNSGSGCSGGTDPTQEGYIRIVRRFDTLMDVTTLDRLEVNGVIVDLTT